jgi:GNAT superfamily N-acetyltransferase
MTAASIIGAPARPFQPRTDRLRLGAGLALDIRPLTAADAGTLQDHVRALSARSRHNRYLGGVNELSRTEIDRLLGGAGDTVFPLVADVLDGERRTMVGEAVYAIDRAAGAVEFALSVNEDWQGRGIGTALLDSIACRAAETSARLLHGETLRGNAPMLALAGKVGAAVRHHRGDPRLVRMERELVSAAVANVRDLTPCERLDLRRLAA